MEMFELIIKYIHLNTYKNKHHRKHFRHTNQTNKIDLTNVIMTRNQKNKRKEYGKQIYAIKYRVINYNSLNSVFHDLHNDLLLMCR